MKKLKITQVKSGIHRMIQQKRTLTALGLTMNKTVEKIGTPQILGMLEKVKHLVTIEETK